MLTVWWETLRESFHRRIALALIVISLLVPLGYFYWVHFRATPQGVVVVTGGSNGIAANLYAQQTFVALLSITGGLWLILALIAAAPLLTSPFEKNWAELLLSKGVARWRILAGRGAGALSVFVATIFLLDMVPALFMRLGGGVPIGTFCISLLFLLLSFVSLLAMMTLLAITRVGAATLIVIVFAQTMLSSTLANRAAIYRLTPSWGWLHPAIEWAYRILPKGAELERMATGYFLGSSVQSWFPIWSTAMFAVCALGLAVWGLARKSF